MVIIMDQIMEEMDIVGEGQGVATSMGQCHIVVDLMVLMVKMMWLMEMVGVMEQEGFLLHDKLLLNLLKETQKDQKEKDFFSNFHSNI